MSDKPLYPLRPTNKLIVELRGDGAQFASKYGAPPIVLGFPELLVVSELEAGRIEDEHQAADRISEIADVPADVVARFLKSLVRGGRMRRRKAAARVADVPVSPRATQGGVELAEGKSFALKLPLALRQFKGSFQLLDHDGLLLLSLSPAELVALSRFVRPTSFGSGMTEQRKILNKHAVEESRLKDILCILQHTRLLQSVDSATEQQGSELGQLSRSQANKINFARQNAAQDELEKQRFEKTGVHRPMVIPVWFDEGIPAALGLVFAYAKTYQGGKLDEFYDFRLNWVWDDDRLESYTARPAVYLCSNYLWSHERSIAVSEKVKRLSPSSITVHGGPDTPKYEGDAEAYFRDFPHVDVIVRGEGEASAAELLDKLSSVIGDDNPDLSVLEGVQGISYRYKGEIVRNPDRPRIADLDTIPSPYLTGLFDAYKGVPRLHVSLETNRGCPYGCTFCDWGSATTSKIRKFDLDRVFGELQWCSDARVQSVSQADANFGVFERDVAIAEKVAELKQGTGYPEAFGGSYAKNSTKYLEKIIKVMAEAGILAQGVLSLQTMDDDTLSAIKRSNIKVEKYDALANEMRNSNLQLSVELMMGLPGATLDAFVGDLQQCIDRDIPARINHTTMLVNSPMNAPAYREEHQLETSSPLGPGRQPVLVSTKTYTRDDLTLMLELREVFNLLDNFGVLRLFSRFMRQQTGMTEMEFYRKLHDGMDRPAMQAQWPLLSTLISWGPHLMGPVYSWKLLLDELREFVVEQCGVPDNSVLDAILKAQHALLPAHDREFPYAVELPHDVAAWHSQMLAAKEAGHWRDWQQVIPPLWEFGPARFEVSDEGGWVTDMLGCDIELSSAGVNWDMGSDISRARVSQSFTPAWEREEAAQAG